VTDKHAALRAASTVLKNDLPTLLADFDAAVKDRDLLKIESDEGREIHGELRADNAALKARVQQLEAAAQAMTMESWETLDGDVGIASAHWNAWLDALGAALAQDAVNRSEL